MAGSIRLVQTARPVVVNGVTIPRADIAREAQHHPAANAAAALEEAARALAIRELLLQEARHLNLQPEPVEDEAGRIETDEEAMIRGLVEREVQTPASDEEVCRRYYESNPRRFMSPDIYEVSHILIQAPHTDADAFQKARAHAQELALILLKTPGAFADLARQHSACPSAEQGGNLGQISTGQTTPEFEAALAGMAPGTVSTTPVETRYGFHVIRLERRHEGRLLPFELVRERIAEYLDTAVRQRAMAQYIAVLAGRSEISGVDLCAGKSMLVQ